MHPGRARLQPKYPGCNPTHPGARTHGRAVARPAPNPTAPAERRRLLALHLALRRLGRLGRQGRPGAAVVCAHGRAAAPLRLRRLSRCHGALPRHRPLAAPGRLDGPALPLPKLGPRAATHHRHGGRRRPLRRCRRRDAAAAAAAARVRGVACARGQGALPEWPSDALPTALGRHRRCGASLASGVTPVARGGAAGARGGAGCGSGRGGAGCGGGRWWGCGWRWGGAAWSRTLSGGGGAGHARERRGGGGGTPS